MGYISMGRGVSLRGVWVRLSYLSYIGEMVTYGQDEVHSTHVLLCVSTHVRMARWMGACPMGMNA